MNGATVTGDLQHFHTTTFDNSRNYVDLCVDCNHIVSLYNLFYFITRVEQKLIYRKKKYIFKNLRKYLNSELVNFSLPFWSYLKFRFRKKEINIEAKIIHIIRSVNFIPLW